jgi:hypothetical protein
VWTPSDFPLARLTQAEIDRVTANRPVQNIYTLSPLQEGMLFETLQAPGSGIYIGQLSTDLEAGPKEIEWLREGFEQLLQRHPVLRTGFVWDGSSEPLQVLEERGALEWREQDWRGLSCDEQAERMRAFLLADRARGFDLSRPPLTRVTLIHTEDHRITLIWTHHHLLLDGWSAQTILFEILSLCDAHARSVPVELPHRRPYTDYIEWLRRQDLQRAERFWRGLLRGIEPSALPADTTAANGLAEVERFQSRTIVLPSSLVDTLATRSKQQRITVNTIFQAAWALFLSTYTDRDDGVFGAVTAGRPPEIQGIEGMVGLFTNTLPVRFQVHPSDTALDLLLRLQSQQSEAREYEYTPLVQIRRWTGIPGSIRLFETILVFENYPSEHLAGFRAGRLRVRRFHMQEPNTNYPITAIAVPGSQFALRLTCDSRMFDSDAIGHLLEHWSSALTLIAGGIDTPLAHLRRTLESEIGRRRAERQAAAIQHARRALEQTRRVAVDIG